MRRSSEDRSAGILPASSIVGGGQDTREPPTRMSALHGKVSMEHIRYSAACCQTDLPNPVERKAMRANTDRMLSMIDSAVAGAAPFLPVRLVVFPEFAHSAPVFETAGELLEILAVQIPNEHTERLVPKASEHDSYIQSG